MGGVSEISFWYHDPRNEGGAGSAAAHRTMTISRRKLVPSKNITDLAAKTPADHLLTHQALLSFVIRPERLIMERIVRKKTSNLVR